MCQNKLQSCLPRPNFKTDSCSLQAETNSNPGSHISWMRDSRDWSSLLCSLVIEVHYWYFMPSLNCKIIAFSTQRIDHQSAEPLSRKLKRWQENFTRDTVQSRGNNEARHSFVAFLTPKPGCLSNYWERVITRLRVSKRRSPFDGIKTSTHLPW
jgi:hypothetical protein